MHFIQPLCICLALATSALGGWTHPGILHSTADLTRVKNLVAAETQPWYEAYQAFAADSHSSLSYSFTSACPVVTRDKTTSLIVCMDQFASDSVAARQLALMWTITGTTSYATKATTILSSWGSTLKVLNGSSLITFLLNFLY
jgi:hypothetical protein